MPMHKLLAYSYNYFITSESLWNYYKDEVNNLNHNASDGKSFKY